MNWEYIDFGKNSIENPYWYFILTENVFFEGFLYKDPNSYGNYFLELYSESKNLVTSLSSVKITKAKREAKKIIEKFILD